MSINKWHNIIEDAGHVPSFFVILFFLRNICVGADFV